MNFTSRGSYQRRVIITTLQHNEGYTWHSTSMKKFIGSDPPKLIFKFAEEQERLKAATLVSKKRPDFNRKPINISEIERDYGETAVAVASREIDVEEEIPAAKQKYIARISGLYFIQV